MSEQAAQSESANESAEIAVETEQANNNNEVNANEKPAGYDPVDISDLPPEKQKALDDRINYLYRQVKDGERTRSEYRNIAQQQSEKINELMSGMGVVVDYLGNKSIEQSIEETRVRMQSAWEKGDVNAYHSEQEKLLDLKADQKVQKSQKSQPLQQKQQQPQRMPSGASQIAADGVSGGEITQQDADYIGQWQDERDASGQYVRPWATNQPADVNQWSTEAKAALMEAQAILNNPAFARMTIEQKMNEVDRRMGTKKPSNNQAVMGGTLTTRGKTSNVKLSPQQERIAVKTKFGARDGAKTDADFIAAYRKQIASIQSSKGSR